MAPKTKPLPTQKYLKECFSYCPTTGVLTWKVRPETHFRSARGWKVFNSRYAGKPTQSTPDAGYLHVGISGAMYKAHRVIWKLVTGRTPNVVDHRNGDSCDNRLANLRNTNREGNARNAVLRRSSKSGLKGVCWCNTNNKWLAQIVVSTKHKHLGLFTNKEAAHEAYKVAAKKYHGEYANFGTSTPDKLLEI